MFALKNGIENLVIMHSPQYQDTFLVPETDKITPENIVSWKTISVIEDILELYQLTYFLIEDVTKLGRSNRLFF